MKILQVIPFFAPHFGGSFVNTYNLSRELAKNGHEITIITTDFQFNESGSNSIKNLKVLPFKCAVNLGQFYYSPSMANWLENSIKNFDLIHLHNYRSYQNNVVHKFAKKYDVPYILQARGSLTRSIDKKLLKISYDCIWGKQILMDATKLVAVSKVEAEQYLKLGLENEKIEIIPNSLNLSKYSNLPRKGTFRLKYKISKDTKILLFLGRLHKVKGIDLLIKSFSDLVREADDIRLVIAGPDDGFLPEIKKLIDKLGVKDKVLIPGALYEADKAAAFIDADVFVLPSIYEIFGNTILEAWAYGTPVIVTDNCAIADFVAKAGLVVKYDKDSLRDAIKRILDNDQLKSTLTRDGLNLVKNTFDIKKTTSKMESIYEGICNSSTS